MTGFDAPDVTPPRASLAPGTRTGKGGPRSSAIRHRPGSSLIEHGLSRALFDYAATKFHRQADLPWRIRRHSPGQSQRPQPRAMAAGDVLLHWMKRLAPAAQISGPGWNRHRDSGSTPNTRRVAISRSRASRCSRRALRRTSRLARRCCRFWRCCTPSRGWPATPCWMRSVRTSAPADRADLAWL